MDIGTYLRECRERRGITLHQIAASTKLSSTTLQLIERNAFDHLPGGIFTKGYLRAYAAEVGVDPEAVVDEYLAQCAAARVAEEPPIVPQPARATVWAGYVPTVVLAIAVALVAFGLLRNPAESPVTSSMQLIQAPRPVESLETESAVSSALPASDRDEQGFYLDIQPTAACWVSAKADGRMVLYRLIHSGERVTVVARDELVIRVGDPEAFAYTLNGERGRPLGEAGEPVTVKITESNYQTFLAGSTPKARRGMSASVG